MADVLIGTLLFVAIVIGWFLGKWERRPAKRKPSGPGKDYFHGVNLLLNEQQDEAMEVLLGAMDINPDTIDTYLVMGSLFRRRGEVDRAIRIHQDLLARPALDKEQTNTVRLELAKDYLKAGVYDRSERLLKQLVKEGGDQVTPCLKKLQSIYEQEREWSSAIAISEQLEQRNRTGRASDSGRTTTRIRMSHYYCELATLAINAQEWEDAQSALKAALKADAQNARASLLIADMENRQGHYQAALSALKRIPTQAPEFIPEMLAPMETSYNGLGQPEAFIKALFELMENHPVISVVITLADKISAHNNEQDGAYVLGEFLKHKPSVKGLNRLLQYHLPESRGAARENLTLLQKFLEALLAEKPNYRCQQCGFEGKQLYWQCPSCQRWGTITPIHGLEGE